MAARPAIDGRQSAEGGNGRESGMFIYLQMAEQQASRCEAGNYRQL